MILYKGFSYNISLFLTLLFLLAAVGCVPTTAEVAPSPMPTEHPINTAEAAQPTGTPETVTGCAEGGAGVFTPEDVRCYLASFDPQFVREIDADTAVLFTDPTSIADWIGGAIIYHVPTFSTLVLDRFGDVDPQFSHFTNRAGLAALSDVTADPMLMAELHQAVQQHWQTTSPGTPEVRLSTAWQDGQTTVFLIAIAGLAADDDRFYCANETWKISDVTAEIVSECIARDEDAFIRHVLFSAQEVAGQDEQPVQVALDGVPSNVVMVREGKVAAETAVYQTLIQQTGSSSVIVRGETLTVSSEAAAGLAAAVNPAQLENFTAINQKPHSLRYLFQNSSTVFVQPNHVVERDYLPGGDCIFFQNNYPGLGSVIGFSRIGFNEDQTQALVWMQVECVRSPLPGSVFILEQQNGKWQVTQNIAVQITPRTPELDYTGTASGCGDIFVYRPNGSSSEFIIFYATADIFALSTTPSTLNLAETGSDAAAQIDLYADSVSKLGEFPYCNDVAPMAEPQSVWTAVSGTATITLSQQVNTELCAGEPYQATVLLENVTFRSGTEEILLASVLFDAVTVGWCAG
ncbi:MAG: hypothetical protein KC419_12400 [Anaerolineales bacterium]|nr:hypothetical protein [Anaerolineales bacterium]MCA9929280.1 hypothetical protein [Anaerolineales bacterium]